ncbi:MAG TPA: TspO/MBR family protein [Steroidobacteraceae bacterium]|nr:TspO/MBR family protein [Steroidobacteraceae bacterium]
MRIPIESATSYRGRNARPNWFTLVLFIGLALAAGLVGYLFSPARSAAAAAWYAALAKPPWVAPAYWLAPLWAALYCLMGGAAWLVSRERYHKRHRAALGAYFAQLLLNAAWAPLFFGTHNAGAGLFTAVALWLTVAWTMREFIAVRAPAALMLAPYLGWVTFAMALNFSIWRLNQ